MGRTEESYKAYIRELVGEGWWKPLPEVIRFQEQHLSPAGARIFALEHCVFAKSFPRWFGNIVANCPELDARRYMIENMYVEEVRDPTIQRGHYESLVDFAVALGCQREEVYAYPASITTTMGLAYFDNIARTLPWKEAFASIGVLELINNDALAARYGQVPLNSPRRWAPLRLKGEAMSHWQAAEVADGGSVEGIAGHGEEALEILARYARDEEQQEAAARALAEALRVFKFQYDDIGLRAIEASRQVATAV